jgi:membrane protein DedA with SNARE-associated domain
LLLVSDFLVQVALQGPWLLLVTAFLSVTILRLISFVRTAMPLASGMSGLSCYRYLRYERIGLVLWCTLYMTMGVTAGERWHWAAQAFGLDGATVLVAAVVAAGFVVRRRFVRWRARRR